MDNLTKEQNFFIDLIQNTDNYLTINYNKEYQKYELQKQEKENNIVQFDIKDLKSYLENNNLKDSLKQEILNINTNILYKSQGNGISHNIKVLIYAFIMCKEQNLNSIQTRIILDSCKYHDIGRKNDEEDIYHGERSSNKIDSVIKDDDFYSTTYYKNLLKAAMDIHSKDDNQENIIATKYNIDLEDLRPIYCILKDADALDRIRLTMFVPLMTDLDANYLRTKESKKLIKFASQLNTIYYLIFLKNIKLKKAHITIK